MLIVFGGADSAPSLRELNIRDNQSGFSIPVGGLDGWDGDFLQTQTITFAPMIWSNTYNFTSVGDTDLFWCRRLSKLIVSLSFATLSDTAKIAPVYYDGNSVLSIGDIVNVNAIDRLDQNGRFMSQIQSFNLFGANKVALSVFEIIGADLNVIVAGV